MSKVKKILFTESILKDPIHSASVWRVLNSIFVSFVISNQYNFQWNFSQNKTKSNFHASYYI